MPRAANAQTELGGLPGPGARLHEWAEPIFLSFTLIFPHPAWGQSWPPAPGVQSLFSLCLCLPTWLWLLFIPVIASHSSIGFIMSPLKGQSPFPMRVLPTQLFQQNSELEGACSHPFEG